MTNNQKSTITTTKPQKVVEELNLAVTRADLNAEAIVATGLLYNKV